MALSLIMFIFFKFNLNLQIIIAAFLFTLFALVIVPMNNGAVDATKYFAFLDYIRHIRDIGGLGQAWQAINSNAMLIAVNNNLAAPDELSFQATPVMGLIMLGMSFFSNEWLMALVAFGDYYFAMKIIQLVVEHNHLGRRYFCFGYFIFCNLFVYSAAVSGIRNNFVGTVFAYCAFRYAEKGSQLWSIETLKLMVVTVLLSLIHQFTLILFALFVIALLFYKTVLIRLLDGVMFLQSIFQAGFLALLTPLSGIPFFSSIIYKSGQYLGSNATIHISSAANIVRDLARLMILIALFILVWRFCNQYIDRRYTEFILLLFCFIIGSFRDQLLFDRCLLVMLPIMLPYITMLPITAREYSFKYPQSVRATLLYLMLVVLVGFSLVCLVDNLRAGSTYFYFYLP